ncbi:ArsR/SmtB family transcription factor [Paenibacillus sp. GCM10012306]|uniref:ArsR/SmtB family transcription factor n=1 Tax=Paenibacillus sp. GCM10012306 TaxID=3317342 RepID=UPI00361FE412
MPPTNYIVEVDFAPIYECVNSLNAFLRKQSHAVMDSGKLWVREVQQHLSPALLQKMRKAMDATDESNLYPYIWNCPGDRSVTGFLDWLDALSSGELYEIAARYNLSVPPNLPEIRDLASEALRAWNTHYFSGIDQAIIEGLAREAEYRREMLNKDNSMEVYEQATQGMRLYPTDLLKQVVIIPQYHTRPLVTSAIYDEVIFTSYSCDVLPPGAGRPPAELLRLTHALSDETRLCILRLLAGKQLTFTEIVREVGLSKSTVHYHLITLRAAGLVIVHFNNKTTDYSLRLEALSDLPRQISNYMKI